MGYHGVTFGGFAIFDLRFAIGKKATAEIPCTKERKKAAGSLLGGGFDCFMS